MISTEHGPDERFSEEVKFRLTPKEKADLKELARKSGMKLSAYIRWRLLYSGEQK